MALHGDGSTSSSLDMVIETMRQTGRDMKTPTRRRRAGGLAVNVTEC